MNLLIAVQIFQLSELILITHCFVIKKKYITDILTNGEMLETSGTWPLYSRP